MILWQNQADCRRELIPLVVLIGLCSTRSALPTHRRGPIYQRQQVCFDFRAGRLLSASRTAWPPTSRSPGHAGFFDVHDDVGREDFRKVFRSPGSGPVPPGIQGVGFARAIRPADLQTHIDQVRAEGFPLTRCNQQANETCIPRSCIWSRFRDAACVPSASTCIQNPCGARPCSAR